jgi:hypothetical protein
MRTVLFTLCMFLIGTTSMPAVVLAGHWGLWSSAEGKFLCLASFVALGWGTLIIGRWGLILRCLSFEATSHAEVVEFKMRNGTLVRLDRSCLEGLLVDHLPWAGSDSGYLDVARLPCERLMVWVPQDLLRSVGVKQ